ncbi:MAG: DHH family phosphoesterase [Erysipelotrichaceae bacterium]
MLLYTLDKEVKHSMKYQACEYLNYLDIMKKYNTNELVAKVIASKHLSIEQMNQLFVVPKLSDPMLVTGIKQIVDRLHQALLKQEQILVCGDYDADGICATSIIVKALKQYGLTCGYYIPNRFKEGYGLNEQTVHLAKEKGYKILLTVDNGVKSLKAASLCKSLGMGLIISDHHSYDEIPPCDYFLHPTLMQPLFQSMSGAGVALLLSRALIGEDKLSIILAGIATIGDVMPLWDENRSIVRLAIEYLKEGYALPIQKLVKHDAEWNETLIAFQVVPKLNATGRLSDIANANMTVRYLLSENESEIMKCSKQINDLNELRKIKSEEMNRKAYTMVKEEYPFQVIYDADFHEGLLGIVAGKLSENLNRPVMVLTRKDKQLKGSIRARGDLDLTSFFEPCIDLFDAYGGHKSAAGISIDLDNFKTMRSYINETMKQITIHDDLILDYIPLTVSELNIQNIASLSMLSPFGQGFSQPLFSIKASDDMVLKSMSQGKHLKWSNDMIDLLYFNQGQQLNKLKMKQDFCFIGTLSLNQFANRIHINMIVQDLI